MEKRGIIDEDWTPRPTSPVNEKQATHTKKPTIEQLENTLAKRLDEIVEKKLTED